MVIDKVRHLLAGLLVGGPSRHGVGRCWGGPACLTFFTRHHRNKSRINIQLCIDAFRQMLPRTHKATQTRWPQVQTLNQLQEHLNGCGKQNKSVLCSLLWICGYQRPLFVVSLFLFAWVCLASFVLCLSIQKCWISLAALHLVWSSVTSFNISSVLYQDFSSLMSLDLLLWLYSSISCLSRGFYKVRKMLFCSKH